MKPPLSVATAQDSDWRVLVVDADGLAVADFGTMDFPRPVCEKHAADYAEAKNIEAGLSERARLTADRYRRTQKAGGIF